MDSNAEAQEYTLEEVSEHDNEDDCWIVVEGKVYDITTYLDYHPGGKKFILTTAGTDATQQFIESTHSQTARDLMVKYFIGNLK